VISLNLIWSDGIESSRKSGSLVCLVEVGGLVLALHAALAVMKNVLTKARPSELN
jgi:hypothetical protein